MEQMVSDAIKIDAQYTSYMYSIYIGIDTSLYLQIWREAMREKHTLHASVYNLVAYIIYII